MSTELMSRFLEGLHASRLLDRDRIEELLRRPEPPQGDMEGVARFLESKGWLTRYQIDEIREGRADGLTFSGYRLLEKLPDSPAGRAHKAYHPALQQAVLVRWVNPEWLKPADTPAGYVERARMASLVSNPHAVNVLDAGLAGDSPFVVEECVDGVGMDRLVNEMGALPVTLACEYARQAAVTLAAYHERGVFHGDFSPARMIMTPVVRRTGVNGSGQAVSVRPAPGAAVKVEGTGLVPVRPPAGELTYGESELLGGVHYLAPERLTSAGRDAKGDLYSLGASIYFLLAARPPLPASSTVDALLQLQQAEPVRIDKLRTDLPADLADLIHRLMAKNPSQRPAGLREVADALQSFASLAQPPAPMAEPASGVPLASETSTVRNAGPAIMGEAGPLSLDGGPPLVEPLDLPTVEPLPENTSDSQVYSPRAKRAEPVEEHHDIFGHHGDDPSSPRLRPKEAKGGWTLLILGACLHLLAVAALVCYFAGFWPFEK